MKENIIGQEVLINELSRIFQIFKSTDAVIRPHFILTGPSGSGKSFTISQLAQEFKLGFFEINAAQLTKEGTSGNSLSKALSPLLTMAGKPTIVFVDEFDKLFISGNSNDSAAHESTTGVQNEFLKILEAETTQVFGDYGKYINASVGNVLFIFAGAFNGEEDLTIDRLRTIGLKTEFLGRVGLVYNTKPLTMDDLFNIINRSVLLNSYVKLFPEVEKEVVINTLMKHIEENHTLNTLGARLINTLVHQYFIKGGKLTEQEVEEISFQETLTFK